MGGRQGGRGRQEGEAETNMMGKQSKHGREVTRLEGARRVGRREDETQAGYGRQAGREEGS